MLDFAHTPSCRLFRHEEHAFQTLPVVTKAVAAYLRILADPDHGWLFLPANQLYGAFRAMSTGPISRGDQRVLMRSLNTLLQAGYLTRCRLVAPPPAYFHTADGRDIPLSPWLDDADADWLVITHWVPSEHALTPADTQAWHHQRKEWAQTAPLTPE